MGSYRGFPTTRRSSKSFIKMRRFMSFFRNFAEYCSMPSKKVVVAPNKRLSFGIFMKEPWPVMSHVLNVNMILKEMISSWIYLWQWKINMIMYIFSWFFQFILFLYQDNLWQSWERTSILSQTRISRKRESILLRKMRCESWCCQGDQTQVFA